MAAYVINEESTWLLRELSEAHAALGEAARALSEFYAGGGGTAEQEATLFDVMNAARTRADRAHRSLQPYRVATNVDDIHAGVGALAIGEPLPGS
jgi:hypothetical protein